MSRAAIALLIAVVGCDAHDEMAQPDAAGATTIVPPAGTTTCEVRPPFVTLHDTPTVANISSFGLYMQDGALHAIATDGWLVHDIDLATDAATPIPSIEAGFGHPFSSVTASPDGAAVWFSAPRDDGTYETFIATRASGFTPVAINAGSDALITNGVAFHDGTVRAFMSVPDPSTGVPGTRKSIEMTSDDGVTWTPSVPSNAGLLDVGLTSDGCAVIWDEDRGVTNPYEDQFFGQPRGEDGVFNGPLFFRLVAPWGASNLNVSPDWTRAFFLVGRNLYEVTP